MSKNRVFVTLLLFAAMSASVYARKSAYARFGYGELSPPAFSAGRAMGGIGYGVRDAKMLNPMNPASYSATDSLAFLFDVGVYANTAWYADGGNKAKTFEGNIDHAGLAFRIVKGLGLSLGMMPFSSVNYTFGETVTDADITRTDKYTGEGGFTRIYLGLGYSPFKNFSIGANASYFFGRTIYSTQTIFSNTTINDNNLSRSLKIQQVLADVGVQYALPLGKDKLTLGVVYSPKLPLSGKSRYVEQVVGADKAKWDTTTSTLGFDYPQTFGAGLSYTGRNKYMVGADVEYQQWSSARFFDGASGGDIDWCGADAQLRNRLRLAVGGQYVPDATGRNYFGKIRYRIGTHYSNSYFRIQEDDSRTWGGTKEFGVSAGFGFPMIDNRSFINLSFDYISVVPEHYFKITISYTMNEIWFRKIKLE